MRTYYDIDELSDEIEIRDGCYGEVNGACGAGVFLTLENGESAFAHFSRLPLGTKVLCTVLKKANQDWKTLVSIDSVLCGLAAG